MVDLFLYGRDGRETRDAYHGQSAYPVIPPRVHRLPLWQPALQVIFD